MSKKLKILIIIILIISIGFIIWRFVIAPRVFFGITDCQGKPNGVQCSSGGWLDILGRPCGGKYCYYGFYFGICANDRCEDDIKPVLDEYIKIGMERSEYTIGEDILFYINNRFDLPLFCDECKLTILKKDKEGMFVSYEYFKEDRSIDINSPSRYKKINAGKSINYEFHTQDYEPGEYKVAVILGLGKTYETAGIWSARRTAEFVIK